VLLPRQRWKLARGAEGKEHAMSQNPIIAIATVGIDIGKNSFHVRSRAKISMDRAMRIAIVECQTFPNCGV
jgi:hypothetical protein